MTSDSTVARPAERSPVPAAERPLRRMSGYRRYTRRKKTIIGLLAAAIIGWAVLAVNLGAAEVTSGQVLSALLGRGDDFASVVVWHIRLPRIIAGIVAGAGLAVAGAVMQNNLRNPLASPSTLGIASAAAFGANVAIIVLGAGSVQSSRSAAVSIDNPYLVTICAFGCAMVAALVILMLAKIRSFSPEAMVLAGVALGSLFSAGTILIQYFAQDVQVAAVVFWTFGDLGRASWNETMIMAGLVVLALGYFLWRRWDYNAIDSGEETAKGLGVKVERVRIQGMFLACLLTAAAVSFLGIIGFIGLVAPHIMRRIIGVDHRFLLPATVLMGSLLLLFSDTLARTVISPVVLPVGAITAFLGAPVFLYVLAKGAR